MGGTTGSRLTHNIERVLRVVMPERLKVPLRRFRFAIGERSFRPYSMQLTIDGLSLQFYIGDAVGNSWYGGSPTRSLSPENAFIRDMIKPGDTAFDCGAHHGMTTILLANWVGKAGTVVSFEASPHNASILRKNIELNDLSQVRCENKAIAAAPGVVRITEESNTRVTPNQRLGEEVEAVQIDQYLNYKPAFVKIDIEGFEVEALKGAQQVLALRPKFAIEVHTKTLANFDTSVEELLSLIELDKYDVWIQWNDSEQPVPYSASDRISDRVHLFGIPKTD